VHWFVLHGISLRHEHLISFSKPVGANKMTGTIVGLTAVYISFWPIGHWNYHF